MIVQQSNKIESVADYVQAVIVCWASSGKPNFRAYVQGFTDAHLGSDLITQDQARAIREELKKHKTSHL